MGGPAATLGHGRQGCDGPRANCSGVPGLCIRLKPAAGNLDEYEALFVDGRHDMLSVAVDFLKWAPQVCSGGVLAGQDP